VVSELWDKLVTCQNNIIDMFDNYGTEFAEEGLDYFNQPDNGWINRVWHNDNIRRAHIDVVDARESKGLWMMHVCIFPQLHNNGPIYGFDVIAGKNKMTGAFHDFSPLGGPNGDGVNHNMVEWFEDMVQDYVPSKKRELPEWALNIFSGSMVAAGNVSDLREADTIINLAQNTLKVYLEVIGDHNNSGEPSMVLEGQNWYCHNQQQNPHTPKVMKSLGLNEADVERFCTDMLFPKTV
jgi:phycocyanobilin:ferredoxin oxidoreductase